MTKIHQHPY